MSTLFQLHSDLKNLKDKLTEIATLWQEGDGVILLGETVAFSEWLFSYVDFDDLDESSFDKHDFYRHSSDKSSSDKSSSDKDDYDNSSNAEQTETNDEDNEESDDYEESIDWFALQNDIDQLNPETKSKLELDTERLIIISDVEWVSLTKEYDRVMTVSA